MEKSYGAVLTFWHPLNNFSTYFPQTKPKPRSYDKTLRYTTFRYPLTPCNLKIYNFPFDRTDNDCWWRRKSRREEKGKSSPDFLCKYLFFLNFFNREEAPNSLRLKRKPMFKYFPSWYRFKTENSFLSLRFARSSNNMQNKCSILF